MTPARASLADAHDVGEPAALDERLQFVDDATGAEPAARLTALDGKHDGSGLLRTHGDDEATPG